MLLQTLLINFFIIIVTGKRTGRYGSGSHGHSYPPSHGLSGGTYQSQATSGTKHTYPPNTGLSGNAAGGYHRSEVHHHYHYNPPPQINYGSTYHPVYHGTPPVYVYEYRNSGSRFDSLLTGLALYNLGRMSQDHHSYNNYNYDRDYRGSPGEICKLGIRKRTGDYEETRIDCKLMSSFIWEHQRETSRSAYVSSVNVTKIITINNGTKETTVYQNSTTVNALDVKGPSIKVDDGMTCFMIRISRDTSVMKKTVECGLLQAYATRSLYNDANTLQMHSVVLCVLTTIYLYC